MTLQMKDAGPRTDRAALASWENEGGATWKGSMDHELGRRVESDRSWTVYHVFSGAAADAEGLAMTGLSRSQSSDRLLALKGINAERRNVCSGIRQLVPASQRADEEEVE